MTAFKAILFDLDDTLLHNPMFTFLPAYFQALLEHVVPLVDAERFLQVMMEAIAQMDANDGRRRMTNAEVFAAHFFPALGHAPEELIPVFERFYAESFPRLRSLTRPVPEARPLMEWVFGLGVPVVIATNPVFPLTAIEQRLDWANIPTTEFDYALVTAYDNMHATKSHPAYYREVASFLGLPPEECLMAGNEWEMDITSATRAGISAYWITAPDTPLPSAVPGPGALLGRGSLADFWEYLR